MTEQLYHALYRTGEKARSKNGVADKILNETLNGRKGIEKLLNESMARLDKNRVYVEKELNFMEKEMQYLGIQQQQQVKPSSGTSIMSNESNSSIKQQLFDLSSSNESNEFTMKPCIRQHKNSFSNTFDRYRMNSTLDSADSFNNKILNRKYSLGHSLNPTSLNKSRFYCSRVNASTNSLPAQVEDNMTTLGDLRASTNTALQQMSETLVKRLPKIDEIYANKRRKVSFTQVDPFELDIPIKTNFSINGRFKKKLSLPQIGTNSFESSLNATIKKSSNFYLD